MSAAVPMLDAAVWPSAFASSGATYASGGCDSITAFQHKEASTSAMHNPSRKDQQCLLGSLVTTDDITR